ncbi:MAG: ABC transporter ATP-binding protein/permease [Candidatus Marinimicrobia bacterium]|nr:ABC transporter ATP-binding protein/permease [Candidatus Neomarinimicrobiota bacterium]
MMKFLKPYWSTMVLGLIASVIFVVFNSSSVWLSASFIKVLFEGDQAQVEQTVDTSIPTTEEVNDLNNKIKNYTENIIRQDTPTETLKVLCLVIFGIFFLKNVFRFLKALAVKFVQYRLITDIRDELYNHLHKLSLSFYSRKRTGEINSILLSDVKVLKNAFTVIFNRAIVEPLNIIFTIILLFIISWKLTLGALLILPVTIYVIGKIGNAIRRRSIRNSEQIAGVMSILSETVKGIRIVKAFAMEKFEKNRFFRETKKYFHYMFRTHRLEALSSPLNEILGSLIAIILLWFGGRAVLAGEGLAAEDFLRFIFLLFNIMNPLKKLNKINISVQRGIAAGTRIFTILDEEPEIVEKEGARALTTFKNNIEYNDVSFSYNKEEGLVLDNINFSIKKGEVVAFVGQSGAGKTTIVDLLPRFYDVNSGSIKIDGMDIRDITLNSLRDNIGVVTQETILFNDTVKNNIAYGIEDADQSKVREAAKAANALHFIEELEKGFETEIGEDGIKLSGGQKQRLTIARALMKNPPILILDEATSALDTEAEQKVQVAINRLMENRTVFVIAHRLSTITGADKILVLDKGKIVERGTHDQLLSDKDSLYSYYFNLQFDV